MGGASGIRYSEQNWWTTGLDSWQNLTSAGVVLNVSCYGRSHTESGLAKKEREQERQKDGEKALERKRKIIRSLASGKMEKAETISSTPGEQVDPNQTGQ